MRRTLTGIAIALALAIPCLGLSSKPAEAHRSRAFGGVVLGAVIGGILAHEIYRHHHRHHRHYYGYYGYAPVYYYGYRHRHYHRHHHHRRYW